MSIIICLINFGNNNNNNKCSIYNFNCWTKLFQYCCWLKKFIDIIIESLITYFYIMFTTEWISKSILFKLFLMNDTQLSLYTNGTMSRSTQSFTTDTLNIFYIDPHFFINSNWVKWYSFNIFHIEHKYDTNLCARVQWLAHTTWYTSKLRSRTIILPYVIFSQ